jgi:hypothetical protein
MHKIILVPIDLSHPEQESKMLGIAQQIAPHVRCRFHTSGHGNFPPAA